MLVMYYDGLDKEYEVTFSKLSNHVVQLEGKFPAKKNGFFLSRKGYEDGWDYTAYNTVYRALGGAIQFSDDGSVWVEPKKQETLRVMWDDGDDHDKIRPEKVTATADIAGEEMVIELSAVNDWEMVFTGIPESKSCSFIDANPVTGYTEVIDGKTIAMTHEYTPDPLPPSEIDILTERVGTLESTQSDQDDAITDLANVIFNKEV